MTDTTVVIGGGIAGLAAAHELHQQGRAFTVIEAGPRPGGKIDSSTIDGAALPFEVDSAADGFLARQPEATDLCREIGLADDLVAPSGARAFIWTNDALRSIPSPSVLGVPFDPDTVAASGIVSAEAVADFSRRVTAPRAPITADASVGAVLRPLVGDGVFEQLVDPLLGGINAGNADNLSIDSGAPQLAAAARSDGPLADVLRTQVDAGLAAAAGPVFNGVRGGNRRIIDRLAERLGDNLHTGQTAVALDRTATGWAITTNHTTIAADSVILATPAWISAGLLESHATTAAHHLAALTYGDAILVTFVVDREHVDHHLDGSGFLVPRNQGLLMTACSWASSKWAHYDDGTHAIFRVSAGRTDDPRWLTMDPQEVVATLEAELRATVGVHGPLVARATPWRQSLPQYRPGHLARCDEIDADLLATCPGVVVTGAQMRGLGIPACVRQGRAAARSI